MVLSTLTKAARLAIEDGAQEAHCRRVAAWSTELESKLQTPQTQLPQILELAEALDEHFEWEPFGETAPTPDPLAETAFNSLRAAKRADLDAVVGKLPVFPAAAQKALQVLLREDWNAFELESIAKSDPVLAAHLIRAANSWIYGPRQSITTIPHAITYIGAKHTTQILCAAAMKPLFASATLRQIWDHSVEAAQVSRQLARVSGAIDPEEAFLAGLVHDAGRLAMAMLPAGFQVPAARLIQKGCETVLVERALCGFSHAEAGAITLRAWGFPESLAQAVEHHHQPERSDSKLAALLYLTEHWTNSCEDLPSLVRLKIACGWLGLTAASLAEFDVPVDRTLKALRFA
jgi:putative nucleotidyltransferase with HDIG domain